MLWRSGNTRLRQSVQDRSRGCRKLEKRPNSQLLSSSERVIGERSLITEYRPWANYRRTTDVTTTPGDCSGQLCGGTDAGVWPDHRILNACALLDKTSLAQHRVDDLCAWLDLAVVADHRQLIDLRDCRCIK